MPAMDLNHDDGRPPRPAASPLVLGTMGWGTDGDRPARADAALQAALAAGVTVLDTADIYGGGDSERAVGAALAGLAPEDRARLRVQTKCGIVLPGTTPPHTTPPHTTPPDAAPGISPAPTTRYDSTPGHLKASLAASLERLGVDRVDVMLIHRPDLLTPVEQTVRAFLDEREAGRVDRLGVSNLPLDRAARFHRELRRLSADGTGLDCVQVELGLHHRALVEAAVLANHGTAAATAGAEGLPQWCADEGVALQAWGPLGQGRYTRGAAAARPSVDTTGGLTRDHTGNPADVARSSEQEAAVVVQELADRLGLPGEAVVLGWLRRLPWDVRPVVGTMDPGRIAACARADEAAAALDHADWYRLLTAARGVALP